MTQVEGIIKQAIVDLGLDEVECRILIKRRDDLSACVSDCVREIVVGGRKRDDDGMSGFALLP